MDLLDLVIILALVATIAVMVTGIISMGRGGTFDRDHANQFMWGRVGLQGIAILLLLIALIIK